MKIALCILMGYLLGSLSPSALIARIKKKNIRKSGSGNLGATNTLLHFGRGFGVAVMVQILHLGAFGAPHLPLGSPCGAHRRRRGGFGTYFPLLSQIPRR